jgi:hypothetical protein
VSANLPAPILAPADLEALTGYRRPSAQIRALRAMGIEHWVRPDGRPVVRADWRQAGQNRRPVLNVAAVR